MSQRKRVPREGGGLLPLVGVPSPLVTVWIFLSPTPLRKLPSLMPAGGSLACFLCLKKKLPVFLLQGTHQTHLVHHLGKAVHLTTAAAATPHNPDGGCRPPVGGRGERTAAGVGSFGEEVWGSRPARGPGGRKAARRSAALTLVPPGTARRLGRPGRIAGGAAPSAVAAVGGGWAATRNGPPAPEGATAGMATAVGCVGGMERTARPRRRGARDHRRAARGTRARRAAGAGAVSAPAATGAASPTMHAHARDRDYPGRHTPAPRAGCSRLPRCNPGRRPHNRRRRCNRRRRRASPPGCCCAAAPCPRASPALCPAPRPPPPLPPSPPPPPLPPWPHAGGPAGRRKGCLRRRAPPRVGGGGLGSPRLVCRVRRKARRQSWMNDQLQNEWDDVAGGSVDVGQQVIGWCGV